MSVLRFFAMFCLVGLVADSSLAGQEPNLIETGAFKLETLPFLQTGVQTHQFCSYDRAGDNYDAEYFPLYFGADGECVIFDAMGPGCLYRQQMNIWYAAPVYRGIHIRYYFDNEAKPRIDMDVSLFFSTNNPIFQPPLAFDGYDLTKKRDRFRVFYHPMYFKKRLKVALSSEPGGPPNVTEPWTGPAGKFPGGGSTHVHWYQYTYRLFPEDMGLNSWTPETGRRMMPELVEAWNVNDEHKLAAQDGEDYRFTCGIRAGKTATLWKRGHAGAITELNFQISPTNNADALFNSWLKITFDGASRPQVEAPFGCLLGIYRTKLHASFDSLALAWTNNQVYCYFSMPFWKSAVIQVENRGTKKVMVKGIVIYKTAS